MPRNDSGKQELDEAYLRLAHVIAKAPPEPSWSRKAFTVERFEQAFWKKVQKAGPDDCWPWIGTMHESGYGYATIHCKHIAAHRASYMLAHPGEDIRGLVVAHECDNPPCVNPAHLTATTQLLNMRGAAERGRMKRFYSRRYIKITEEQAIAIIARLATGEKQYLIAADYGVAQSTISFIYLGKTWPELPRPWRPRFA